MSWKVLSKKNHAQKLIKPKDDLLFLKNQAMIPICIFELQKVTQSLPVVFAKDAEYMRPYCLMGLKPDENLLVNPNGSWGLPYLPALIDVYPFRLGKGDDEKFVLVFDEASKLVDEKEPGIPLFNSDGTESDLFKKYIDRLVQIESSHRVVEGVSALLDEFNLLVPFSIKDTENCDGQKGFGGLFRIDLAVFDSLDDQQFIRLRKASALSLIYGHFFSMVNISRLQSLKKLKAQQSKDLHDLGSEIFNNEDDNLEF